MRVVIVKYKKNGMIKVYGSLEAFLDLHPEYAATRDKINYRISRLKENYEDDSVRITRHTVIKRNRKKKT
jgi:hypothetical protein